MPGLAYGFTPRSPSAVAAVAPSCSGPPLLPIHQRRPDIRDGGRIRRPSGPPRRCGGVLSSEGSLRTAHPKSELKMPYVRFATFGLIGYKRPFWGSSKGASGPGTSDETRSAARSACAQRNSPPPYSGHGRYAVRAGRTGLCRLRGRAAPGPSAGGCGVHRPGPAARGSVSPCGSCRPLPANGGDSALRQNTATRPPGIGGRVARADRSVRGGSQEDSSHSALAMASVLLSSALSSMFFDVSHDWW